MVAISKDGLIKTVSEGPQVLELSSLSGLKSHLWEVSLSFYRMMKLNLENSSYLLRIFRAKTA
jgi:hypothetical protein